MSESSQKLERTAELEIELDRVLPFLATEGDTLASLGSLGTGGSGGSSDSKPPGWFTSLFGNRRPAEIRWSTLSNSEKKSVLNGVTEGQFFFSERKIRGLKILPGAHPLGDFQNYVEIADASDAGKVRGVEVHLRKAGRASDVGLEARAASRALGRDRQHLHVHMPMEIRSGALKADPLAEAIRHGDLLRREELFSQFMTVFETSTDLSSSMSTRDGMQFSVLSGPGALLSWMRAFERAGNGGALQLKAKTAIGVRGDDFYDAPGLWGVEARSLHRRLSDHTVAAVLDGFEQSGNSKDFGYDGDRVRHWLTEGEAPTTRKLGAVAEKLYPDYEASLAELGKKLRPGTESDLWGMLRAKIESPNSSETVKRAGNSKLLKMMGHIWERDVLFHDTPEAAARIGNARVSALRKLLREEPIQEVTREFLLDSGVFQAMGDSLGIAVQPLTP